MDIVYTCENRQCRSVETTPYLKTLQMDAVMDEKNIATMFCPYCERSLVQKDCGVQPKENQPGYFVR
jgi:aspartate carbamoyltransferase regulatory subunit